MSIQTLFNVLSALEYNDSVSYNDLRRIRKEIRKYFGDDMPKKYWFITINPYIYMVSKAICIELPSYGNEKYRKQLYALECQIQMYFECEIELYDGKTTFIVKKIKGDYTPSELIEKQEVPLWV